jgi:hypothetical protein
MTGAGVGGTGKSGEKYALVQANRRASAVERFSGRSRSLFARDDGHFAIAKAGERHDAGHKLLASGGFRFK